MSKRIFILTIIFLFITTMGFGCKGLSTAEIASVKPLTLNYWTVYNNVDILEDYANEYKTKRPYVTINIRKVRADEFDKLFLNALADDVPPDIISVSARELPKYLSRLAPMPETVDVSRIYKKGQYFEETVVETEQITMPTARYVKSEYVGTVYDDAVVGGKIYGLPLAMDDLAVFYNKGLLDKAGIPEPPKDWGAFMEAVKAISKIDSEGNLLQSGVALGTGNNIENVFDILTLFMVQSGVKMSQSGQVTFANGLNANNYNDSPVVKALNFYVDFARPNKEVYSWNNKQKDALDEFARGKTAFYFGFAYELPTIKSRAPQMNLEVIPMFQLNEETSINVANYWLESVVKKSKKQNEAWDFVQFITNADKVKDYVKKTGRPTPFRAQIEEQKKEVLLAPFVSQILNAGNWYRGKDYATAQKAIKDLVEKYGAPYTGKKQEDTYRMDLIENAARTIQQTL